MKQTITILVITGLIITAYTAMHIQSQKEQAKLIQDYTECITKQSQEQGYIIRHYCSSNYQILDQLSGLQYTQKGYNLYLKQ